MPKPTLSKFSRFLPLAFLAVASLLIAIIHFKSRTWLIGWDNLHPEFDFWLNIRRSFFSVWQEYQGLGLLAGMGHAADLPRQIFLYLASFFVSLNQLRYFFTFLMLGFGPVGVYFFVGQLIPKDIKKEKRRLVSFLGGLFYLLNLATVQIFYLPFETFTVFYGFLPWFFYLALVYFKKPSRKNLSKFSLVSLLGTTSWYVPTLFVVYLLGLAVFFLGIFIKKRKKEVWQRAFWIFLVTLVVNAFWLLPYAYFTLTSSHLVGQAQQNFMATEDIFLRNKEFGDLGNVPLLRGFWFKFVDWDVSRNFDFMAAPWRDWLVKPFALGVGFSLFAVVLLGLVYQFLKKSRFSWALALLFLLAFGMLANDTWPFSLIISVLQRYLPLFGQIFRVPFTKFGILAAFSYSLLFAFGGLALTRIGGKVFKKFYYFVVLAFLLMIFYFVYPIFRGNLFYEHNQLVIPREYFQLMEFFEKQDRGTRIANFPQQSFWGWNHFRWNYRGSGFLWYGVEQPILDRAFDGFSRFNENYYWQVSRAIYSQDLGFFEAILEKYQINWLVLDKNILASSDYKGLYLEKLEEMFDKSEKISLVKSLDKIQIYQVNLDKEVKDFVFLTGDLPYVETEYRWSDEDVGFLENGDYLATSDKLQTASYTYYPFRSLFTGRRQEELEFEVEDKEDGFVFSNKISEELVDLPLALPELSETEAVFFTKNLEEVAVEKPEVLLEDGKIYVKVDKKKGYFSYDSQDDRKVFKGEVKSCNPFNDGLKEKELLEKDGEDLVRLTSVGSGNCLSIDLGHFSHKTGYIVKVKSRYFEGKSLLFYILNKTSENRILETYLPKEEEWTSSYFIIPPMGEYGLGYSLHFDNISIGREESVNDLGRVEVYPIPYRFLKEIKISSNVKTQSAKPQLKTQNKQGQNGNSLVFSKIFEDFGVEKKANWLYKVELPNGGQFTPGVSPAKAGQAQSATTPGVAPETLVLSQAYHPGWMAYQFSIFNFQFSKLDHVLVNNWENGFLLNSKFEYRNSKQYLNSNNKIQNNDNNGTVEQWNNGIIYILFWPQILEFIGLGVLIGFGVLYKRYQGR